MRSRPARSDDIPEAPGIGATVPAAMVSRVAGWALGDQVEVVAPAASVAFAPPGSPA